ncbi:MAG TPA: aldo/keto reductase [Planctomycetota bacterium]|nr:aldo/keto reductase [Planctomycetota bacterium]
MPLRPFGPDGVPVPVLGQGTWRMEEAPGDSEKALRRGIERGMTHIDTAEMYGSGRVEEIVGAAIRGLRDRVFLASKVLPSNASYDGTLRACERSLKRLGTDRLDLYLLHWLEGEPLEGTIRAFEKLRADGKIVRWGVSNFDVPELEQAVAIAGEGRVACNQVLYHLEERTIEHAVLPWCEARGISVVAYTPLGRKTSYGPAVEAVAKAKGATPAQVALAFLVRRPSVFAIPKASRLEHVDANAAAATLALTDAEAAAVDRACPVGPWRGLAML